MLAVIVTIMIITGRSICSTYIYCGNKRGGLFVVLTFIVKITGRYICNVNSYCDNNDNNGEVYM